MPIPRAPSYQRALRLYQTRPGAPPAADLIVPTGDKWNGGSKGMGLPTVRGERLVRSDLGWTLGTSRPAAACIQPPTSSSPRETSGTAGRRGQACQRRGAKGTGLPGLDFGDTSTGRGAHPAADLIVSTGAKWNGESKGTGLPTERGGGGGTD